MWRILAIVLVVGECGTVRAQLARYAVLQIAEKQDPSTHELKTQTNSLSLGPYEVAELVSFPGMASSLGTQQRLFVETPVGSFDMMKVFYLNGPGAQQFDPLVVPGNSKVSLIGVAGYAVFKVTPNYYQVDKTSIVLPGPGGAEVQFECSTDLVHWTVATPGTYTNLPAAKFFRVNLKKVEATQ